MFVFTVMMHDGKEHKERQGPETHNMWREARRALLATSWLCTDSLSSNEIIRSSTQP